MLRCTSRTRSRQLASHRLWEISDLNVGVQSLFSYQRLFSVLFFFPSTSLCRVKKLLETLPYDTWVNLLSFLSPMNLITFEKVRYGLRSSAR